MPDKKSIGNRKAKKNKSDKGQSERTIIKKTITYKEYEVICDLIEEIIRGTAFCRQLPDDTNITEQEPPYTYRFVINDEQQRADAIIRLLFGKIEIVKDHENHLQMKTEAVATKMANYMKKTGANKEKALDKFQILVPSQNFDADEETARRRLSDTYDKLKREKRFVESNIDWEELYLPHEGKGVEGLPSNEDIILEELRIILPWLRKYEEKIINLLKVNNTFSPP